MHCRFVRASSRPARQWRKLYRATKWTTHSLVAKFPQCSVVAGSTRISRCRGRTLQTRPRTGVCKPLMHDVMAPKVHQNNRSYVSSADLPSDSLRKNLAWWAVTRRTLKRNTKLSKLGGGHLPGTIRCHVLFPIGQPPYSDTTKVHITQF